jgi:YD repeat-containing protein
MTETCSDKDSLSFSVIPFFCRSWQPERRYVVYNHVGYLTRRIDRRGLVREFQYDTLGRNTAEIWYDTAADAEMDANRQNTLNFTYDALGRMLSAGDQFAGYVYAYDRLGRMISSDAAIAGLAPTVTLTNAYDAVGRRTQVAAAIGGNADFVTDYMYDQLGARPASGSPPFTWTRISETRSPRPGRCRTT